MVTWQATTSSLEALKDFSSGDRILNTVGDAAAIPFYKRAIEVDPNLALLAHLGLAYTDMRLLGGRCRCTRKAFDLRNRTSEPEKYFITAIFHKEVTGNLEAAEQSCEFWKQAYPRSETPHDYLSGAIYPALGQYEKGAEEGREAVRLNPHFPLSYAFVMFNDLALNRLGEAKATYKQPFELKLSHPFFSLALYQIVCSRTMLRGWPSRQHRRLARWQ